MTSEEQPSTQDPQARRQARVRARRRAEVFGEVLPETTGDERSPGETDQAPDATEEWLRANVPPHHGA